MSKMKENKREIKLKKEVSGVLEDYNLFVEYKMKSWDRDIRDRFFKDFLIICKRYAGEIA